MLHSGKREASLTGTTAAASECRDTSRTGTTAAASEPSRNIIASAFNPADTARGFLKIVPVTLKGPHGHQDTYALLDDGSTVTIIDEDIAAKLGLDGPVSPMWIQGIGGSETRHQQSRRVSVGVRGQNGKPFMTRGAHTVKGLKLAAQSISDETLRGCKHLASIKTALTYKEAVPKILIGQDNWDLIVSRSVRQGRRNQPVASRTRLGWVLHGCRTSAATPMVYCTTARQCEMAEMFREYASLESLGIQHRSPREDPESKAVATLETMSRRLPSGRFETGLLWKDNVADIPDSYGMAARRLTNLEGKLDRNPELKTQYEARIDDLLRAGYAEIAPAKKGRRTWYLPHFCVTNPAKEKIRVVYDAAARCRGTSLNDMLLPGPDFLQSLPAVLMKFRQYPVAVSADIKEMFLQIRIREEDRDALRFLWRGANRNGPPTEYRMTSVVFGANSSPCTALYIKNRNAKDYEAKFPEAARAIRDNHYMDDYLQSFKTSGDALKVAKQVDDIHRRAQFELRGWASNDAVIKQRLSCEDTTVRIGGSELEKTLGLLWDTETDNIMFRWNKHNVDIDCLQTPTKRQALSAIMSVFDPLGLIAPITTPAKRIFQDSWKFSTGWDEPLPKELLERWQQWISQMAGLASLRVPRCYECGVASDYELHTFVDASEEAYAAAVYWRITCAGGVTIALAMAKSRVTPTKIVSVPRLELQAAVLGVRIAKTVAAAHEFVVKTRVYWSDSRTALTWIRAEPRAYKPFVAHRLAEIEDETRKDEWRWIPTAHNVADDATRSTPPLFDGDHRWYRGPAFLYEHPSTWPVEKERPPESTGEERHPPERVMVATRSDGYLPDATRFSSWLRLVRATARVLQFIELCRAPATKVTVAAARRKRNKRNAETDPAWNKTQQQQATPRRRVEVTRDKYIPLEARYVERAVLLWVRASQTEAFGATLLRVKNDATPAADDKLRQLSLYIDDQDVLRLKGRICNTAEIQADAATPIVLCGKVHYTQLFIQHVHEKLHHGGVEIVVNELRQSVYMAKIRPTVKSVLYRCQRCRLERAKPAQPATGDLPPARLAHHARPFTYTGVDYFGPIEVTVGRRHEKRYVALFTCMTSRAVHLEVVHSLSSSSCISALRRFIARRGAPTEILSDNATCFKGADKELAAAATAALADAAASHRIRWHFLPPAAPFMAGAWERMVRTVKTALRATLRDRYPSDETLITLLAEVEATVNSRPLTHVAVDADEPPALTPNLLLLGPGCSAPSLGAFSEQDETARAHWKRAQQLADVFWSRWVREYLPLLQHRREPRSSGVAPKVGDLVVVCDPTQPRNTWPRGKVTRVFPGPDEVVRVADIETSGGHILRRPTKKLAVLPVDVVETTAGVCYGRPCK